MKKKRSLPKSSQKDIAIWRNAELNSRPISTSSEHQITYFNGNNFLKFYVKPTSMSSPFMLANKITLDLWFLTTGEKICLTSDESITY